MDLDLFEPFDALVSIELLGRTVEVPENNCLLRALQYVGGEAIAYGRFCWNDECGNCEVTCVAPATGEGQLIRACQVKVYPGMKIMSVSEEIQIDFE